MNNQQRITLTAVCGQKLTENVAEGSCLLQYLEMVEDISMFSDTSQLAT